MILTIITICYYIYQKKNDNDEDQIFLQHLTLIENLETNQLEFKVITKAKLFGDSLESFSDVDPMNVLFINPESQVNEYAHRLNADDQPSGSGFTYYLQDNKHVWMANPLRGLIRVEYSNYRPFKRYTHVL